MDNDHFKRVHKQIGDDGEYYLSDRQSYEYMKELTARIEIDFFTLSLIENTIDYCEAYVTEFNVDEIIEHIIHHFPIGVPVDMDEMAFEVCDDLGYEHSNR